MARGFSFRRCIMTIIVLTESMTIKTVKYTKTIGKISNFLQLKFLEIQFHNKNRALKKRAARLLFYIIYIIFTVNFANFFPDYRSNPKYNRSKHRNISTKQSEFLLVYPFAPIHNLNKPAVNNAVFYKPVFVSSHGLLANLLFAYTYNITKNIICYCNLLYC